MFLRLGYEQENLGQRLRRFVARVCWLFCFLGQSEAHDHQGVGGKLKVVSARKILNALQLINAVGAKQES
jgi:hypothetical protein